MGLLIGTVSGSILEQVFGLGVLNQPLMDTSYGLIEDFYLINRLDIRLTPAGLLGLIATVWLLYKKG